MRSKTWTRSAVAAVLIAVACIGCRYADMEPKPSAPPSLPVVRELADVKKVEQETAESAVVRQYITAAKKGDVEGIRAPCTPGGVESAVQQAGRLRGVRFEDMFAYTSGGPHRYLIDAPEWQGGAEGPQPVKDVMMVQLLREGEAWKIESIRTERIIFQRVFFATLPIETLDERDKSAPLP
ncbi:MAG: hypothetical protein N3D11_08945 [Candidatus Sumerlaeia bacterium]|nr:hypothetical protein [Candidatus Sumerlaeia bacterium]